MPQVREGYYSEQLRDQALRETKHKLIGLRLEVYNIIVACGPISNEDIAEKLDRRISSITGRVFELREDGYVQFGGKTLSAAGINVSLWRVTEKQLTLPLN